MVLELESHPASDSARLRDIVRLADLALERHSERGTALEAGLESEPVLEERSERMLELESDSSSMPALLLKLARLTDIAMERQSK